jgi:hypothetical protein
MLTIKSGLYPHMINKLKGGLKLLSGYFLWLRWVPTISVLILAYCSSEEKGVKLLKMVMHGVRSPQSTACGFGASVSRIELCNSDRSVSLFMIFYVILLLLFTYVYYMYETRSWHTYRYALGLLL